MDDRGRKERRHRPDERRGRMDEPEQVRGHKDKRRRREGDESRRCNIKSHEVQTHIQESPFKALKSLQQSPTSHGHSAFVQQWLGEVDGEEVKKPREEILSSPLDRSAHRKHSAIAALEPLHKTTSRRNSHQKHARNDVRRRRRHTATDSSMLQPVNESPQGDTRTKGAAETVHNRRSTNIRDDLRKRMYSSDEEISSSSELPQASEIFDKRRRHKTKEGRYDARVKKSKAAVEHSNPKKKTKKVKRGDAAKVSRAAGEELIRNFASNKIAQERLTMRPGAGIFRNGKASSPSRKRGISDLAFSEMDFLSHSKNKLAAVEKEVVTSKHGQKLQRDRERTRNEISDYFAPRQPLQAIPLNRQEHRSSIIASDRAATTVASSEFGGTSYFEPASPQRGRLVVKEQYLGFGTNISSPRKFSLPALPQEPIYVRPTVETERSGSRSTSYVSWSETEKSQPRHSSPARRMDKEPLSISSSPSMLRMRLIKSGMLDGLGLTLCRPSVNNAGNSGPHLGHSSSESVSHRDGSPFQQDEGDPRQPRSHLLDQLRRRQLEVARRAMLSSEFVVNKETSNAEVPRNVLASRAYLRPPPSSVPRRPATTTPVRESSQNRVLSRSSLQNEMMQDPGARDECARPSAEFEQERPGCSRQGEDHGEYRVNLPSHIQMPVNGDDNYGHQLWAQDQMAELDHGARRMEAGASYEFQKDAQIQYEQLFDQELEEHVEQPSVLEPDYQENVPYGEEITQPFERPYHQHTPNFSEESRADRAPDYAQPPPEPDPMSQYFRTPRGQSYFQQGGFGRHGFQDDTDLAGLLQDDQLEGFWATKRW